MFRHRFWIPVLLAGIVTGGWLLGQGTDTSPKKGLPKNWSKLGLTDEQRMSIDKVQGKYGGQIRQLKARLKELAEEENTELLKILTPTQKERLRDIVTGEKGKDKDKDKTSPPADKGKDKDKDKDK
jgi:hypothetical protein